MHRRFSAVFVTLLMGLAVFSLSGCRSELMEKLGWGSFGFNKGYSPEQPIPFSHERHAGQLQIQCQYCHNQAERSKTSNIPALSTCMNCHIQVRNKPGTTEPSPYIAKIVESYSDNKPMEWVKVHMLPDHVQFNHSAHVKKLSLIHI